MHQSFLKNTCMAIYILHTCFWLIQSLFHLRLRGHWRLTVVVFARAQLSQWDLALNPVESALPATQAIVRGRAGLDSQSRLGRFKQSSVNRYSVSSSRYRNGRQRDGLNTRNSSQNLTRTTRSNSRHSHRGKGNLAQKGGETELWYTRKWKTTQVQHIWAGHVITQAGNLWS